MRQYIDDDIAISDPEEAAAFLRLRGIVPASGRFTEAELGEEMARYGWRWLRTPHGVTAEKTSPRPGELTERITANEPDLVQALAEALVAVIQSEETLKPRYDLPSVTSLLVYSANRNFLARVEARGGVSWSPEHEEQYRITLWRWNVSYAICPFFLLTVGTDGFLWDQRDQQRSYFERALKFSLIDVYDKYAKFWREDPPIHRSTAPWVITRWLEDLARLRLGATPPVPPELVNSPFVAAMSAASVEPEYDDV
ncbi:MAG: hypothetical protein QM692_17655 [Thermomicrobiales bacterium]